MRASKSVAIEQVRHRFPNSATVGTTGARRQQLEEHPASATGALPGRPRIYRIRVKTTTFPFSSSNYFGFARVTTSVNQAVKSAINGAIRRGILAYDYDTILRIH